MAKQTGLDYVSVAWAFVHTLNRWPKSLAELKTFAAKFNSLSALESHLHKTSYVIRGALAGAPTWLISFMAPELGNQVAWLSVPDVAKVLLRGSVEGWEPDKIQANIEASGFWRSNTEAQKAWVTLNQAGKAQAVAQAAVEIFAWMRAEYGPDYVESKGWSLSSPVIKGIATDLASGKKPAGVWKMETTLSAEKIVGTAAWKRRQEEVKSAGEPAMAIENTKGRLEASWREWMGEHITPPELASWAEDIETNKRSIADFETYLRQTSQSLYPGKGEFVAYKQWVSPAKSLVQQMLELGNVGDDDPFVSAFATGQFETLAQLSDAVKRDPRYGATEGFRKQVGQTTTGLLSRMGFL